MKGEKKKRYWVEYLVVIVLLAGVFFFYKYAFTNIFGFAVVDQNVSYAADVESEVEAELAAHGEAEIIVEFTDREKGEKELQKLEKKGFNEKKKFKYFKGSAGKIDSDGLKKLKNSNSVKKIYLDKKFDIDLTDSVKIVKANETWLVSSSLGNITGKGSVCVIDTGIDYNHPSLNANYIGGYDYVNLDNNPMDDHGHGTHVSGIIAANGSVKGVAPGADIIAMKVCNSAGSCSASDISYAIEWCAANKTKYDIKVISMSLGGGLFTSSCDDAFPSITSSINAAVSNGILVFAASGNSGSTSSISAPACISNVFAVGGTQKNDAMYSGGNRNSMIAVLAPGVQIVSTYLNSGTASLTGTSMATPHAAAVAMLILQYAESIGTDLDYNEMKTILKENGKQITDSGSGLTYSRVDAYLSVLSLDETAPSITIESPKDNLTLSKNYVFVNSSSNEKLKNVALQWNNVNYTMNGGHRVFYKNVTDITGNNNYKIFGTDLNDNLGESNLNSISAESDPPSVTLLSPGENSANQKSIAFLYKVTDDIDETVECEIGIDEGLTSVSAWNNSLSFFNSTLIDGAHIWSLTCIDSSDNFVESQNITFNVEGSPIISNLRPQGNVEYKNLALNFSTDEDSYCRGSLDSNLSMAQMDIEFGSGILHSSMIEADYGLYSVHISCNDSNSNLGHGYWQFNVVSTTTSVTSSSGGGSSGGGSSGNIGVNSVVSSVLVTSSVQESTSLPEERQPARVEQPAKITLDEELKQETGNRWIVIAVILGVMISVGVISAYLFIRKYHNLD